MRGRRPRHALRRLLSLAGLTVFTTALAQQSPGYVQKELSSTAAGARWAAPRPPPPASAYFASTCLSNAREPDHWV